MTTKTFPGSYESLAPISDYIIDRAEDAGFSPNEVYAIQTAVDEACANIIDHAYGGEDLGEIKVNVQKIKNGIQITLVDDGIPFDPNEVPEPDISSPLEIRKERGLGVFFIHKLMDNVRFEFSPSKGNILTLTKFRGS